MVINNIDFGNKTEEDTEKWMRYDSFFYKCMEAGECTSAKLFSEIIGRIARISNENPDVEILRSIKDSDSGNGPFSENPPCKCCGCRERISNHRYGETLCKNCGLVLEENLPDPGPEWCAFDDEQMKKRARAGGPLRHSRLSLGVVTVIDRYDRDIKNNPVPVEMKAKLYRLRRWQSRANIASSRERHLSIALPEIDRMCSHLDIPNNIKEECARLYRKCHNNSIVKGQSTEVMVAAVIYIISGNHSMPKTLKELEIASGVKGKAISRCRKKIQKHLNIKRKLIMPYDYVPRIANELDVPGEIEANAVEILQKGTVLGVFGGTYPMKVASAAIYYVSKNG